MKRIIRILTLFCIVFQAAGQNRVVEGKITNAQNERTSVAGVHVFTGDRKIGTVSNPEGYFKLVLPPTYYGIYLYFSKIGFEQDSIVIPVTKSPITVALIPKAYELSEVYIMPDSTLLTLLRRAYMRIPENYPTEPTLYEGFYRESSQNDKNKLADFIEAHLSIYKDPYDKPGGDPGKVELLKSRKRKMRNTGILYYGGPFLPISKDVVLQREPFINPRHFRKYLYELKGIRTSGKQSFYEIAFSTANQDTTRLDGRMWIEKESLAYAFFELKSTRNFSHPQIKKRISHSQIHYEKVGDTWYYRSYTSQKEDFFRFSDKRIAGSVDYLTTRIQTDSVSPIPFDRQLAFLEPFVLNAKEYDPKGWTDYALLENVGVPVPDFQYSATEAEAVFQQEVSAEERKSKFISKLASFINRTYMDMGLIYNPASLSATQHRFHFLPNPNRPPFLIDKRQAEATQYPLLHMSIGYRLNKNISFVYESADDLFNKNITSSDHKIGIKYSKNLKNTGRLIFLEASLLGTLRNHYANLGKYDNPTSFRIGGKEIDARKISFWYGTQQQGITPQIALKQNTSRFFSVKLFLNYNIPLSSKDVFRIKEEQGGLFSKKIATIRATHPTLTSDKQHAETWNSLNIPRWQAGITLVFN